MGEITSSAAYFTELFDAGSADGYARADRGAVTLGADKLEEHAMKAAGVHVFKKRRRIAHIQKQDVNIAGVEDVAESGAAAGVQWERGETGFLGHLAECAIAIVAMEQEGLAIAWPAFERVDLWIDVATGHEKIEPRNG